jgi:integrase
LDHVQRRGVLPLDGPPAGLVTPDRVRGYVVELQGRVGSVTIHAYNSKLRRIAELMAPDRDFGWLREIEGDLNFTKVPRSKYPRLVASSAIVEAGLTLFREAELASSTARSPPVPISAKPPRFGLPLAELRRAVLARDGLMIALLAVCPIRLKNFAALTLGKSLRRIGNTWWIVIDPKDTKAGRADERPIPEVVTAALDRYVSFYRPALTRGRFAVDEGSFWISSRHGTSMSKHYVELVIRCTTLKTLGVEVGPHMFRAAAATESAASASHIPGLAAALLQHRDQSVTEEHYNRATAYEAARVYSHVLGELLS